MGHHTISLQKPSIAGLDRLSAEHPVSPHSILLATYIRVLSLIHNSRHITTCYIPGNIDYHSSLDVSLLSLLSSTSAVNITLDKNTKWIDLAIKCDAILNNLDNNVSHEKANAGEFNDETTHFQTAFRVIANNSEEIASASKLYKEFFGAEFPLLMSCIKSDSQEISKIQFSYNAEFYDSESIRALGGYYLTALNFLLDDASGYCLNNKLISSFEIDRLTEIGTGKVIKLDEKSALQTINSNIAKNPEKTLLEDENSKLSGLEVVSRVNDLIEQLCLKSFRQKVVAVALPRSNDWVCSLVAIMNEGAIYLPIDLSVPPSRNSTILAEAKADAVICSSEQAKLLATFVDTANIELLVVPDHRGSNSQLTVNAKWNDIAYVLFTSGSTGIPKGALIEHAGMANHLLSKLTDLDLSSDDVIAQTAPVTFDISVWQALIGLYCGAKTVVYSKSQQLSIAVFFEKITSDKITILEIVPSYFSLVLDYLTERKAPLTHLRMLILTGEPLKHEQVNRWFALYPDIEIVNAYGPTECSDDITHHRFQVPSDNNIVPIGKPICNMRIHILDDNDELVPHGTLGNICVSGIGVGLGYVNSDEKTREAFDFNHDLAKWSTGRLYRTGDIGRWRSNGELEYFGRNEDQIKIRGMRVELGEIENAILEITGIKDAAVTFEQEAQTLTGYYIGSLSKDFIFESLVKKLPSYMLPKHFVSCESFPLSPAGKTDKKRLKDLSDIAIELPKAINPLETKIEKQIAKVWAALLKIDVAMIDKSSNFFQLGGNSLLAAAAVSQLHGICTLKDLYSYQNIELLATAAQAEEVDI